MNQKKNEKILQKISKINPFIDKHNWECINFPSGKDDWKKLKKVFQGLLLMFQMLIMESFILILKKFILPTFENMKCERTNYSFNDSKWSRIALYCSNKATKLLALLRGITSTHDVDFYPLICLHSFRTKHESHKNVCRNVDLNHIKTYVEIKIVAVLECSLNKVYY